MKTSQGVVGQKQLIPLPDQASNQGRTWVDFVYEGVNQGWPTPLSNLGREVGLTRIGPGLISV